MNNLEKGFYRICGVALVFVAGISIGSRLTENEESPDYLRQVQKAIVLDGLTDNDAGVQTEPDPEYKVVKCKVVEGETPRYRSLVQEAINEGCKGGYVFHQMVVTSWGEYDIADTAMLIFKKK